MAGGHVNRANRPNTWLHRPSCKREESPCQQGAVHTWLMGSYYLQRWHMRWFRDHLPPSGVALSNISDEITGFALAA